jgi:hypothetical protein
MYKLFEIVKWASRISLLYNFSIKKSYISFFISEWGIIMKSNLINEKKNIAYTF